MWPENDKGKIDALRERERERTHEMGERESLAIIGWQGLEFRENVARVRESRG